MNQFDKLKSWSEKFESKPAKIVALWGSLAFICGVIFPAIGVGATYAYRTVNVLIHAADHVEEGKELNSYQNFMIMQLSSAVHEELDSKKVYDVMLEESNNGDLWYFTEENISGVMRPVIYSANLKHKSRRVYVQDMYGNHKWIK